MQAVKEFFTVYWREIVYFELAFVFWPLGEKGFFLFYIVTYWLSKREGSNNKVWTFINFILLATALNYVNSEYRSIFLLRDWILLTLIHFKLMNQPGTVRNASSEGRILMCLINLLIIVVSGTEKIVKYGGSSIPGKELAPYVMSLMMIATDMLHIEMDYFFNTSHGDRASAVFNYATLLIKASLVLSVKANLVETVPFLQCLTFFMLDLMSRTDTTSTHAISFKVLSTTYLMSALLV